MDRADRSAATVRKALRIACSLASSRANVNDFATAAILARHSQYSIRVNDQWRICFEWPAKSPGATNVEILDDH